MPLWPNLRNWNGEGNAAPVRRSVFSVIGIGFPANLASDGFGSKVSTCDAPPFMNRCRTRLALAGSGGVLGASGFTAPPALAACRQPPLSQRRSQRHHAHSHAAARQHFASGEQSRIRGFIASLPSIDKAELIGFQQHLGIARPYRKRLRPRTGEIVLRIPGIGPAL